MRHVPVPIIANFGNAYRVAVRLAEATDQDQRVIATGDPARPFVIASHSDCSTACSALITAGT